MNDLAAVLRADAVAEMLYDLSRSAEAPRSASHALITRRNALDGAACGRSSFPVDDPARLTLQP